MGSMEQHKHYRATRGADASRMSATRFAPYRRIVGEEADGPYLTLEVLECGHRMRPRSDLIGRTFPSRRRCVECLEASCAADGHPLVDWWAGWPVRSFWRCRCTKVLGEGAA